MILFVKIQSNFRDMVVQSFLKWGDFLGYLPIYFRDMGYFSFLKGYGIPETPFQA